MGLFEFFNAAGQFSKPDPSAIEQAGETGQHHANYHKKIVLISCVCGAVGVLGGLALSYFTAADAQTGRDFRVVIMGPILFGAAGLLLGVALACLFAPREFLTGPLGQKWMTLIGTSNVFVARIVCLILGLMIVAPFVGVALLLAFGK